MGIRDVLTLGGPPAARWNMSLAVVVHVNILFGALSTGDPTGDRQVGPPRSEGGTRFGIPCPKGRDARP